MCGLLDVTVALESRMICGGWSCGSVRSTRGIVCVNYHTPRTPISVHCNFAVRHGNLTSIRDVILVSCFLILWSSSSLWFNDYVLMILLSRTKNSIFFISILEQSLAQGCVQLEPFGLAGLWLCEASLRPSLFPMCFWHSSWFPQDQKPRCSLASDFESSSVHFSMTLHWKFFDMLEYSFPVLSVRLEPELCPSGVFFVERSESYHTDPEFRQWLVSKYPTNHRWSPLEVHQGLFLCVSEHRYNSEISENRSSEHWVSSLEQHDPIFVISHDKLEILTSFDIWIWISDFFFSSEEFCWDSRPRSPPPLCTQRWKTAVLLARFRPSCMGNANSLFFLRMSHLFWFESFDVNLRWWNSF